MSTSVAECCDLRLCSVSRRVEKEPKARHCTNTCAEPDAEEAAMFALVWESERGGRRSERARRAEGWAEGEGGGVSERGGWDRGLGA